MSFLSFICLCIVIVSLFEKTEMDTAIDTAFHKEGVLRKIVAGTMLKHEDSFVGQ